MTNPDFTKPGIFPGLTFKDYLALPGLSRTDIYTTYGWSPAHAKAKREEAKETAAMKFGTLVHLAALEPEVFADCVHIYEKLDGRTKDGKAQREEIEMIEAGGTICMSTAEGAKIDKIRKSIDRHNVASWLLRTPDTEVAVQWIDRDTGLLCKARLDIITRRRTCFIGDIKTTRDARPKAFSKAIMDYGYQFQAAYYLDGFREAFKEDAAFCFVPIEKDLCFACAVYQLDEDALEYGRKQYKQALRIAAKYVGNPDPPAYQQSDDELLIGLPKWAGEEPPPPFAHEEIEE